MRDSVASKKQEKTTACESKCFFTSAIILLKSTEAPCSYEEADFSHKLTTTIKILHQWPNKKVKPEITVQIFLRDNKPRKGQQIPQY